MSDESGESMEPMEESQVQRCNHYATRPHMACGIRLRSYDPLLPYKYVYYYYYFLAHQHKAAGRKTRLDIQNYHCNGNLLCDHSVVERLRKKLHFLFAEPWKGVGKGMLSSGCLL